MLRFQRELSNEKPKGLGLRRWNDYRERVWHSLRSSVSRKLRGDLKFNGNHQASAVGGLQTRSPRQLTNVATLTEQRDMWAHGRSLAYQDQRAVTSWLRVLSRLCN